MPALIFKFLPEIAIFIMTSILGFMLHTGAMDHAAIAAKKKLESQITNDQISCQVAQNTTMEISRETQKKLSALTAALATAKRMHGSGRCIPIIHNHPGPATGMHDTKANAGFP